MGIAVALIIGYFVGQAVALSFIRRHYKAGTLHVRDKIIIETDDNLNQLIARKAPFAHLDIVYEEE